MKKRFVLGCLIALSLVLSFSVPNAAGQAVFGSILGTVVDSQGSAVVGAKVTVTSVTKGTADEVLTNDSGNYTVSHLIPDTYNIRVEAQGFKAYEVKNVQVSADTSATSAAASVASPFPPSPGMASTSTSPGHGFTIRASSG